MTSYELLILKLLYSNNAINDIFCVTKENMKKILDEKKSVSQITFLRKLKLLKYCGYIQEGGKDGRKKRYYITQKGIQVIQNEKQV